jgi:hypothetical protein
MNTTSPYPRTARIRKRGGETWAWRISRCERKKVDRTEIDCRSHSRSRAR